MLQVCTGAAASPADSSSLDNASAYEPLENYALIGNCRTAALVSLHGSIDWLCLPHFSGPSVFASLLDCNRGGRFAVRPRDVVRVRRRYIEDTNVLETVFECGNGRLRMTDFMTISSAGESAEAPQPQHELVRLVECIEGRVTVDAVYQPRPDYARHVPRLARRGKLGWAWTCRGMAAYLHSDLELAPRGAADLVGSSDLRAGDVRHAVLTACENEAVVIHPLGETTRHRLRQTIGWWKRWAAQCRYEGAYREAVVRSCLTLKLLTYSLSGAVVAAPTMSLPESERGGRNWDYRYCWLRDTSIVLMAFAELGFEWEGRAFLEWFLHATRLTQPRLQVMYDIYGETALRERKLDHLEGYRGVGPVLLGNGAHAQLQLDIYGEVVLAAYCYASVGGRLDRAELKLLAGFGDVVRRTWRCPDQSIWEVRTAPRHHTYSKLMCWVALDRLLRLKEVADVPIDASALRREREEIRRDIESNGYYKDVQSYAGYYGSAEPDASLLLLARHQYIPHSDPRMVSTCRYLESRLAVDGFLHRHAQSGGYAGVNDHEHLFAVCTFWLAEYMAGAGRIDEAIRCFERLLAASTDLGLYAEEFHIATKGPIGNFPQAFTHVELIRTALSIDAAIRAAPKKKART
jgi:GH15 family glucan-1,4-alpha-glucosidase